jgi:hypothetical protein
MLNIAQSVRYYHVRNTDAPTPSICIRAATRFLFLDGTAFLIRALGALVQLCKRRGGTFLDNQF